MSGKDRERDKAEHLRRTRRSTDYITMHMFLYLYFSHYLIVHQFRILL